MARKKPYLAVLADGSLVPCSDRDLITSSSEVFRAVRPSAHLRIGRYALAIGETEVAVIRAYSDEDTAEAIAGRGDYAPGRFRKERIYDGIRHIAFARGAFNRLAVRGRPHPMRGLVEYDASLQLAAFKE